MVQYHSYESLTIHLHDVSLHSAIKQQSMCSTTNSRVHIAGSYGGTANKKIFVIGAERVWGGGGGEIGLHIEN